VLAGCPSLSLFEFELGAVNDLDGPLALLREPAAHIPRVRMRQTPPQPLAALPVVFVQLALAMRENHARHTTAHEAAGAGARGRFAEAVVITAQAAQAAEEQADAAAAAQAAGGGGGGNGGNGAPHVP
jgi:hypothetical protein